MLRTIAAQNGHLIRCSARRIAGGNVVRCFSFECAKRVPSERFAYGSKYAGPTVAPVQVNLVRNYCANLPAHTKVPLPALSPTMEQGTIVSWEKKEGDKLNEGDLLAEIETDKATMGFETPEEGYLARIVMPAGSKDIPIGQLLCIIVENEADIAAFKDYKDTGTVAAPAAASPPPPPAAAAPVAVSIAPPTPQPAVSRPQTAVEQRGPRVYASPMAKRLAETQALRLEGQGSGMYGSIKSMDLAGQKAAAPAAGASAAARAAPTAGSYLDTPVSSIRGVIAKRLLESKTTIPHYYLTVEINMDNLMKIRAKLNKKLEKKGVKLSVNDFIIKATAMANKKVPEANSAWMDTVIREFDSVDVSVAVSTERGLITPIVFSADRKGLVQISKDIKELAGKARDGKLQPSEFQGGTVSVSNLGMFGVSQFCAIINPPQALIVAVGTTEKKLVLDDSSEKGFKESDTLKVTLSCDHRVVDGAVGAQWLQYFKDFLEDPHTMLL